MITKTLNLDSAYQDLFAEILEKSTAAHAEDASKPIIDINNIESFFGSIEEIAALDPKFLRLPLDEPIFEIDANSRKITVPAEFRSNGLSVQKDHLAEIIFFRIDRYYDDMDLSNCNIEINWKMGSVAGKTSRFVMAKDIQPGYIIFGWPVDKEITEKSGTVSFAIEFNKKDSNGDITYRFNTLPINVNIKDGLVIDDNIEVKNLDQAVLAILTNSSFGEGDAAVGDIVWLTGNGSGLVVGEGVGSEVILGDFADTLYLATLLNAGVPSSAPANLYAEAFVDSGTEIRYTDVNNATITAEFVKVGHKFVAVEDLDNLEEGRKYFSDAFGENLVAAEDLGVAEELWTAAPINESLKYFVSAGSEETEAYNPASAEQVAAWGKSDEVALFVKVAKVVAEGAGEYLVKAQGQKFDNEGIKIGSGDTSASAIVTVPAPEAPSAVNVTVSELTNVDTGYSFADNIENVVFLNAEGKGLLTAVAEVEKFGALQFTWKKKLAVDVDFANVEEEKVPFQGENLSELEVDAAGDYKVSVVNFLNSEKAAVVDSAIIKASPLAGRITAASAMFKVGSRTPAAVPASAIKYNSAGPLSSNSVTLSVVVNDADIDGQKGTLEYQWFKQVVDEELNASWEAIEGANGAEYVITNGDGVFQPVVKNNFNGSIYTFALDSISVDDLA